MLDEYLKPNTAVARLIHEYTKYGSLVIAFDFDGTVHDYHNEGHSHEMVRQLIRDLRADLNVTLVCWTAYKDLNYVANFLNTNHIPFDYINEGGINLGYESKKPFFSILLDDRCGLNEAYTQLKELLTVINYRKTEL